MLLVVAVLVGVRPPRVAPATPAANSSTSAAARPQQPPPDIFKNPSPKELQRALTDGKSGNTQSGSANGATTELALLADVQLPGYSAPQLRDGEPADADHTAFSAGMQAYAQGDCGSALDALAKVAAPAKDAVAANLYSGLCRLKARQLDRAEASFAAVYAAGDTPALETAEYFMAQAMLLRGDAAGSKIWLNRTVALHGDYEGRAQKQIAALAK
jgi:hypothetical protein